MKTLRNHLNESLNEAKIEKIIVQKNGRKTEVEAISLDEKQFKHLSKKFRFEIPSKGSLLYTKYKLARWKHPILGDYSMYIIKQYNSNGYNDPWENYKYLGEIKDFDKVLK